MRKDIVVTGASSGIGKALTEKLVEEGGYRIFACARRFPDYEEEAAVIRMRCDISNEEQVKNFAQQVQRKSSSIYALVNCAGGFGEIGPLLQCDVQGWWETLRVNLFGAVLTIRSIAPLMSPENHPRIINLSGGGAFQAFPNYSAYAVSKAGMIRLTETLAAEVQGQGIRVNALAPGFVVTAIHEQTLAKDPEICGEEHYEHTKEKIQKGSVPMDVPIRCLLYLLSEKASSLTGRCISASFDPWEEEGFAERVMKSSLYTMQRITP